MSSYTAHGVSAGRQCGCGMSGVAIVFIIITSSGFLPDMGGVQVGIGVKSEKCCITDSCSQNPTFHHI
jgi:hypothetical protein